MVSNDVNTDNSQITPISTTKMETNKMQTTPMNTSKINESKKNDGKDNIIQNDKGSTNHNIMNAGKKAFNTGKEFMKIFRELKGLPDPDEEKKEEENQKEENGNDV